jgi:hypothetical protein
MDHVLIRNRAIRRSVKRDVWKIQSTLDSPRRGAARWRLRPSGTIEKKESSISDVVQPLASSAHIGKSDTQALKRSRSPATKERTDTQDFRRYSLWR